MSRNLVAGFCLAILLVSAGHAADGLIPTRFARVKAIWGSLAPKPRTRDRAVATLERIPGKHLVFVYYNAQHPYIDEWVFNKASIPGAKIVFSRVIDAKADSALISAMKSYDVWIADVDTGLFERTGRFPPRLLRLLSCDGPWRSVGAGGPQIQGSRTFRHAHCRQSIQRKMLGCDREMGFFSNAGNDVPIVRTSLQH